MNWNCASQTADFLREGSIGARYATLFEHAFSELKNHWDTFIKEIQDANAKKLVITGKFKTYFDTKSAEIDVWKDKHKTLADQMETALDGIKKTNSIIKQVMPDLQFEEDSKYSSKGIICFALKEVSKMTVGTKKFSSVYMIRGLPWQIRVDCLQSNDGAKMFGAYVCCNLDSASTSWSCKAEYTVRMLSRKEGIKCNEIKDVAPRVFSPRLNDKGTKQDHWGWNSFMTWDRALDPDKGFIKDDTVILEAEIYADTPVL